MHESTQGFLRCFINLASERLGAEAVSCSDDFFAPMQRMLQDALPIFIADKYDEHGKWMDGWESRRRRTGGNDWCIVKLARAGIIHALEIDTSHFTGNYPPQAAMEVCVADGDKPSADTEWQTLLPRTELRGDSNFCCEVAGTPISASHVRLSIFPDGGVARLRVYGVPHVDWHGMAEDELTDLVAALNGGLALFANDEHFGRAANLLLPGRGLNMGDGWETRRRREPGHDWAVFALAHAGVIKQVLVDTAYFKGNYPHQCNVQGLHAAGKDAATVLDMTDDAWQELLPTRKLQADSEHHFEKEVVDIGAITHVRFNIIPDGGVSRLRLFGFVRDA